MAGIAITDADNHEKATSRGYVAALGLQQNQHIGNILYEVNGELAIPQITDFVNPMTDEAGLIGFSEESVIEYLLPMLVRPVRCG